MPVKRDEAGRRFVQVEAEVPGTPEQVWEAIASGPGISSWFVPTEVEEREGGKVVSHFSPDGTMDSVATIEEWDAPRRMLAKSQDAPGSPEIATEWTVEARSGGTCTVRVVHSWFASTDDWDGQFEGAEHGWVAFFRILRLYLEQFAGQPSAAFQLMGMSKDAAPAAWQTLVGSLGIASAAEGERVTSSTDGLTLAGRVVRTGPAEHPELLLHLEAPSPGIAHLFAMPMGGSTFVPVRVFFYGHGSAAALSREEPRWRAWMDSCDAGGVMAVRREASGRRSVEMTLEVQGTPEQVWEAIATGPGISSWFVRTEVEERRRGDGLRLRPRPPVAGDRDEVGRTARVRVRGARLDARRAAGGDRGHRRGARRRDVHRPHGAQPLRERGRLGRSARELRVGLARVLRDPRAAPVALRRRAVRVRPRDAGHQRAGGRCVERDRSPARTRGRQCRPARLLARRCAAVRRRRPPNSRRSALRGAGRARAARPGAGLVQAYRFGDTGSVSIALYLFGSDVADVAARAEPVWRRLCEGALKAVARGA